MKTLIAGNEKNEVSKKTESIFSKITTRECGILGELKTLEIKDLENISKDMSEINRATNSFGKRQSQFMDLVMTVSHPTPERNLRQILAEIERKRQALAESRFKMKRDLISLLEKKEKSKSINDKYGKMRIEVDIEELETKLKNGMLYVEGALKKIYALQGAYNDIKEKYKLNDWNEKDFERAEEEYHIKKVFEQAFADMVNSLRIGIGNQEYFRQMGINPINARNDLLSYINYEDNKIKKMVEEGDNNPNIGIESMYYFLDAMHEKYKDCTKTVLEKKGINTQGYYDKALFLSNKKTE